MVSDVPRPGHLGSNINDRGDHRLLQHRREPLRIVDAILQAQDDGGAVEVRRHRGRGAIGIGGFDAKEHDLRAPKNAGIGARFDGDGAKPGIHFQPQRVRAHGLDVRRPTDHSYFMPRQREHRAVVAPDRPRAHDAYTHRTIIVELP